ncbi:MAG: DUF2312 domain-containing protein [Pseudomonadota bacterium]
MSEPTSGHNRISQAELRSFVERIERREADKKDVTDDIAAIYAEAKAKGYTTKYIRAVVKLRKKAPSERDENAAMMDLYQEAMGIASEAPLFAHLQGMAADDLARDKVIDGLKLVVPKDGEITVKIGKGKRVRIWRDKAGVHDEEVQDAPARRASSPSAGKTTGISRPGANAPDCSEDETVEFGAEARREDQPITANPFAWDDKRRQKWDEGWRREDGGDGMGPK